MYDDIEKIAVTHGPSIELVIENPTSYPMVNKGAHGAVFRLDEDKCVKIYADSINAELEAQAYRAAGQTDLVPQLYEAGHNYNIFEFVKGPNLYDYLKHSKTLELDITLKIMKALDKMQKSGFTRHDAALWHFLINDASELKLIDVVYAMIRNDPLPVKILGGMKDLGLLEDFMAQASVIDRKKAALWKLYLDGAADGRF